MLQLCQNFSKQKSLQKKQHTFILLINLLQVHDAKVDFKKRARSRIGSFENADHVAGGGDIEV